MLGLCLPHNPIKSAGGDLKDGNVGRTGAPKPVSGRVCNPLSMEAIMVEQGAQYDHIGSKYDQYAQTATQKQAESYTFFRMVGPLEGKRVLDLACGFGYYTRRLKQRGAAQVIGVDISPEMIRLGREHEQVEPGGWGRYRTFVDVGCAQGCVPVQVALAHPHVSGGGFDLPVVGPIFEEYAAAFRLEGRLRFHPGDFFRDPMPPAEVLAMGRVLHDWNLEEKKLLIAKAYAALPEGGALIIYESLIDDARQQHAPGLLMSLNMLIETKGGFDFTGADCCGWMREVGFSDTYVEPLDGPDSMAVGIKG
jgi:SAM-dependent methyltransferase